MKKIKDPNTGVIKYIPDDNDAAVHKLSIEIKKLSNKLDQLEDRISQLEKVILNGAND